MGRRVKNFCNVVGGGVLNQNILFRNLLINTVSLFQAMSSTARLPSHPLLLQLPQLLLLLLLLVPPLLLTPVDSNTLALPGSGGKKQVFVLVAGLGEVTWAKLI